MRHWRKGEDVWVYGYGSLIWRPDFAFEERRLATLHGHHRALCLWSRVNRGTPECPGLVFGLDRGGSCRGVAYRLAGDQVPDYFPALWDREMSTGAYLPRWINCSTEAGQVRALVFVMNRDNPAYIRALPEPELLAIVRRASGRYGPCTEYVVQTAQRCARRASMIPGWTPSPAAWKPTATRCPRRPDGGPDTPARRNPATGAGQAGSRLRPI